MVDSNDVELKYNHENKKKRSREIAHGFLYIHYSEINYFLTTNSTQEKKGLEEIIFIQNQGDNATSTLVRTWRLNMKVLMEIMITKIWTPDQGRS